MNGKLTIPKVFEWLLLVFVLTIPISQFVSVRIFLVVLLFSFFVKTNWQKMLGQTWDVGLFMLVLILGLFYSEELLTGWKVIETSLSLVALPILFNKLTNYTKARLHIIFRAFALGLFIASFICLVNAVYTYSKNGDIEVFFFGKFTEIIDSHPTYFGYYLIAAITFGLYLLYYEKNGLPSVLTIFFLSFFFLILMLTGGTTAFVSMLFVFSFFALKYLLDERTMMRTLTFGLVVLMIIGLFAFNSTALRGKNDYWERLVLWESALKASPDVILGVGTGDYKKVLNGYYLSHNLSEFADSSYNSHNQFIEILFSNGLIGMLSLSILLGRPLYLSVRNQDILGTLMLFPFIIYGMTEVFLGRYQGVVFFALLHQAFVVYYLSHKPLFSLKDV